MGKNLPEEKRIEMAETAARDACKAVLAKDPLYNDDSYVDAFIRERVNTGRARENSRLFPISKQQISLLMRFHTLMNKWILINKNYLE